MILDFDKEYDKALIEAVKALKSKEAVVFPTDTIYGIGCDAQSDEAMDKIYKIKGRDGNKPLAVIMSDLEMILKWCDIYSDDLKIIMGYLPGPYTFIFKLREGKKLAGLTDKIGVRVPRHAFLRKMVEELGSPVAATSANLSGTPDVWDFRNIDKEILKKVNVAIDAGETHHKKPSTVVDIVEKKILRHGAGEFSFQ